MVEDTPCSEPESDFHGILDQSDEGSEGPGEQDGDGPEAQISQPVPVQSASRKPPAWVDPDDTTLQVSLASHKRLRKLRDASSDDTVGGREYERRLRRQYQRINPTPDWASNARRKLHPSKSKQHRSSFSSPLDSDNDDQEQDTISDLLSSTGGILRTVKRSSNLAQGTLRIERLRDANQSAKSEGHVKSVQFHPSPQVPVLLTASSDRRLSLFNVPSFSFTVVTYSHNSQPLALRLTATPTRTSKPSTFPHYHLRTPFSIPPVLPFSSRVLVPFTIPTTCNPASHSVRHAAYGVPRSALPTLRRRTRAWR